MYPGNEPNEAVDSPDLDTDVTQGGALIHGTKLWAFFPPIATNMSLMRRFFRLPDNGNYTDTQPALLQAHQTQFWRVPAHQLEHGVWLTHNPGELLYTPSVAPHAVFTLEPTTLVTVHVETAATFAANVRWLGTELACAPAGAVERVARCLAKITKERVGAAGLGRLRAEIVDGWAEVKGEVRAKATAREWGMVKLALEQLLEE